MLTYSTVMKRYRGENSNVDDIAARFDKHLEEPVHLRLTAKAAVLNLSPGHYQLATVLRAVDLPGNNGGGRRRGGGRPKRIVADGGH